MSATIDLDPRDAALPEPGLASGAMVRVPAVSRRSVTIAGGLAASAVVLWAFAPFAFVAAQAAAHHRLFAGVSGVFPWDGLQYLAYVRDGHAGLIPNLYGGTGAAVFVHPMWSLSGIAQGFTDVGPAAIMAFWKIVGAAVLFRGTWWLVRRHVAGGSRQIVAVVLCLFGGLTPFAIPMFFGGNRQDLFGTSIDLVPVATLWDYAPIAIAIGLLPFAVEGIADVVRGAVSRRRVGLTAVGCVMIGWLHPWQGATLALIAVALVGWRCWEDRSQVGTRLQPLLRLARGQGRTLIILALAIAAPIVYYVALSSFDSSWKQFSARDAVLLRLSFPALMWCVLPVAAIYLVSARRLGSDPRLRPLVAWAGATLVLLALRPPEQYHALDGLMLPVGILVVRAWPASSRRVVGVVVLTLLAATFIAFAVVSFERISSPDVTSYAELRPGDVNAVKAAARIAGRSPILTSQTLGTAVPALVDRPTWIGNQFWTTGYGQRFGQVLALLSGGASDSTAQRIVRRSGARTVVVPCDTDVSLGNALRPLGFRERAFGCAQLYSR